MRRWLLLMCLASTALHAAPTGFSLAGGTASVDTSVPGVTTINQTSGRALLDWTGFDIDPTETVNFVQPGASSIAINRVNGGTASLLAGTLTANGQVWLLNPAGIAVGSGGSVNVAGILMAPATLTNATDVVNGVTDVGVFSGGVGGLTVSGAVTAPKQAYAGVGGFSYDPTGNGLLSVSTHGTNALVMGGNFTASGGTLTIRGGSVTLADGVGLNATAGVTVAASGNLTINDQAAAINAPTTGAMQLTADADGNGAGNLTMVAGDTLSTQGTLATSGRNVTLANLTSVGAQTHNAGNTRTLNGTLDVTGANNALTLNGSANTLAGATALNTNGGALTVNGTVNGGQALSVNAGSGAVTLAQDVGAVSTLASLNATGGTLNVQDVLTTGAQVLNGATTLNGGLVTSSGASSVNGNVTLGSGAAITLNSGGSYVVNGTVDGAQVLTLSAGSGVITLAQAAGGSVPLSALNASGNVVLGNVVTTGAINSLGTTTLNGNLNAGTTLVLGDDTTLTGNRSLTSGGNMGLTGDVVGAHTLTLNVGLGAGDLTLAVPTVNHLLLASGDDVTLNSSLSSVAGLDFSALDDVLLGADVVVSSGGNVSFDAGNEVLNARALTLNGAAVVLGPVTGLTTLTVNATTLALLANVTTTGAQTLNAPVTLTNNVTLGAGTGAVNVNGTVNGARALVVNGGAVVLGGNVGASTQLTSLNVNGTSVNTQGTARTSGNMALAATGALTAANTLQSGGTLTATGGTTTLNGAVSSGGNMVLGGTTQLTAGGAVTSGGTLNVTAPTLVMQQAVTAAGVMNLTATNGMTLNGNVTGGGDTTLVGDVTTSADVGTTSGDLTLTDTLVMTDDVRLFDGGGVNDLITLSDGVSGLHTLSLDAGLGDVALTGNVNVDEIQFSAADQLTFGGGNITVRQALNFGALGQLNLAGDTVITAVNGGVRSPITATGANLILATTSGVDLTLVGGVITLFQIGTPTTGKLATLTVDATTANLLGNVFTTGAQTITASDGLAGLLDSNGGDITLNTNANLSADVTIRSRGGNIYLNNAITGGHGLDIDAGAGTLVVNGALGQTGTPLTTLTVNAALAVLAAPITTSGVQTYQGPTQLATTLVGNQINLNGATTLTGDAVLRAPTIVANGTVDGARALVLDSANATFNASVGEMTRLGAVTGQGSVTTQGFRATTFGYEGTGNLTFNGAGLNTLGRLAIGSEATTPVRINGRLTSSGPMELRARTIDAEVDAPTLTVGSASSQLRGRVGGTYGRQAARRVQFFSLSGGPQNFGSYGMPPVDDYRVPATFMGTVAPAVGPADVLGDDLENEDAVLRLVQL